MNPLHESIPAPAPYTVFRAVDEFRDFRPDELPWKEMRRHPGHFPERDVAKVSRVRTVVGLDVADRSGKVQRVYVKRSFTRALLKRLVLRFRETKEWREVQLAQQFLDAGFIVPEPLLYAESVTEPDHLPTTWLVTKALGSEWQQFKTASKEQGLDRNRLISLADYTRELHERRVLHADYRADHVYFRADGAWAMIDLDGSRLGEPVSVKERREALLQLTISLIPSGLTEALLKEFMDAYADEGPPPYDAGKLFAAAKATYR